MKKINLKVVILILGITPLSCSNIKMAFNLNLKYRLIALLIVLTANSSCTKEEYVTIDSKPVVADLTQVPYPKLSDYNFFEGALKNLNPAFGVLPYKPVTELFSDYALKNDLYGCQMVLKQLM